MFLPCNQVVRHIFTKTQIILFFITFFVVLPLLCYELPYSIYYIRRGTTDLRRVVEKQNARRTSLLTQYLNDTVNEVRDDSLLDLEILIITSKRVDGSHYLQQVALQARHLSLHQDLFNVNLTVCNVHAGPGKHMDAEFLKMHGFKVTDVYPNGNVSHAVLDNLRREHEDYISCLQLLTAIYPERLILVLEDDALMRIDFFPILSSVLKRVKLQQERSPSNDIAFVKLFYPKRWLGWARESLTIVELCFLGALGGLIGALQSVLASRRGNVRLKCIIGAIYVVLVSLAVGRQHLLFLRRIHPQLYVIGAAPQCCSPAVLFTSSKARNFVTFAQYLKISSWAIDNTQDMFMSMPGHVGILVQPSLVEHIGMYSSIKKPSSSPQDFLDIMI